jgi:hypothetical protein
MADLLLIALRRKLLELEKRGDKGRAELLQRRIDARLAAPVVEEVVTVEAEEAPKPAPKRVRTAKAPKPKKAEPAKKAAPKPAKATAPKRAKPAPKPEPAPEVVFTPAEPVTEEEKV